MPVVTGIIQEVIPGPIRGVSGKQESFVEFQYFGELSESVEPVYDEGVVRGASEELPFYSHTSAEKIPFTITFATSVDEGDDNAADPEQAYKNNFGKWLFVKSFAYPDYGVDRKGPIAPPRQARITIGNWFRKTGIIQSPSAQFKAPYSENGYPYLIEVTFTLRVVSPFFRHLFDVRAAVL